MTPEYESFSLCSFFFNFSFISAGFFSTDFVGSVLCCILLSSLDDDYADGWGFAA
jgi:hypothetical protein